jgi:signal transduction histidine kinase
MSEAETIEDLKERLAIVADSLQRAEGRATAGQLALEVMHEVRNPLQALGHLAYLTIEDADEPEKVRKYMRMAEEQVATLDHIANQTLRLARSSNLPKPIDLVGLAEAAVRIH